MTTTTEIRDYDQHNRTKHAYWVIDQNTPVGALAVEGWEGINSVTLVTMTKVGPTGGIASGGISWKDQVSPDGSVWGDNGFTDTQLASATPAVQSEVGGNSALLGAQYRLWLLTNTLTDGEQMVVHAWGYYA